MSRDNSGTPHHPKLLPTKLKFVLLSHEQRILEDWPMTIKLTPFANPSNVRYSKTTIHLGQSLQSLIRCSFYFFVFIPMIHFILKFEITRQQCQRVTT